MPRPAASGPGDWMPMLSEELAPQSHEIQLVPHETEVEEEDPLQHAADRHEPQQSRLVAGHQDHDGGPGYQDLQVDEELDVLVDQDLHEGVGLDDDACLEEVEGESGVETTQHEDTEADDEKLRVDPVELYPTLVGGAANLPAAAPEGPAPIRKKGGSTSTISSLPLVTGLRSKGRSGRAHGQSPARSVPLAG